MSQRSIVLSTLKRETITRDVLLVLGGSLLLALSSQIEIPLFFTPVPITLQTLAVMLLGAMMGKTKGTLAVLTYLAEVSFGLPFLAGGAVNPLAIIGPTGGYLIGFIAQAFLVGYTLEKVKGQIQVFLSVLAISILQMVMGALWLAHFVGWSQALLLGFYPFILGDLAKVFTFTGAYLTSTKQK